LSAAVVWFDATGRKSSASGADLVLKAVVAIKAKITPIIRPGITIRKNFLRISFRGSKNRKFAGDILNSNTARELLTNN
jgi:hypothetical protein